MKRFIVVSGGSIDDDFACRIIEEQQRAEVCEDAKKGAVLIAADKGMDFFFRKQIQPDCIIGDFDSAECESLTYFRERGNVQIRELCPMKDDTDTESAIRYALKQGAEQITLLGATGSRLDHVLGNVELLGIGLKAGVPITIMDEKNRIRMIDRGIILKKSEQYGTYVSLLPYTKIVEHLTLRGFKYPLTDATLTGFCSLGVSNEIVEEEAEITFDGGILLVVEARD